MTIKKRLILSYIAMLIIPFVLIVLMGWIIRVMAFSSGSSTAEKYIFNQPYHYPGIQQKRLERLNSIVLSSPQLLFSPSFMKSLEKELNLPGSFAVLQDNQIKYKSSWISSQEIMEALSCYNQEEGKSKGNQPHPNEVLFRWEFPVPGQQNGIIYYIFDPRIMFTRYALPWFLFILAIAGILIATNGILTLLVSRSITIPLQKLQNAALKIRDGNLDDPLVCKTDDEIGQVFSSFNEMRDRLKASLEKQITYEENRKELIASISHDLRTPLTVIKGYIEGLRDGIPDTAMKKSQYLETIYTKALQMDHLIDDLFLFSRLELEQYPLTLKPLELSRWIRDAAADLSVDYPDCTFHTGPLKEALINADSEELFRVISNIVQNSNHHAGRQDIEITLSMKSRTEDNNEMVLITISDNGKGIPPDELPLIFDQFYQVDKARRRNKSGLGLSIAAMIIKQHGGFIQAENRLNEGLSISITLPLIRNREGNHGS